MLALKDGKNVVVLAGTGYGKTIAMIFLILLTLGKIVVIVPLLKLLQTSQVRPFVNAHRLRCGTMCFQVDELCEYGLRAVAINKDIPNDDKLWEVDTI